MVSHPLWRPYAPTANADRQSQRLAYRQVQPGPLQEHQRHWAVAYLEVRRLIERSLGDRVLQINHVGSTAVPDLVAKPVLDVDLTVGDLGDESTYLPQLEKVGFRLIFRDELNGEAHRHLTLGSPNTNLHVWEAGAVEPQRHALLVTWLRATPDDRDRYAAAKLSAAGDRGPSRYNDLKAAVVYDIYEHAFLSDPDHAHDAQPRISGG